MDIDYLEHAVGQRGNEKPFMFRSQKDHDNFFKLLKEAKRLREEGMDFKKAKVALYTYVFRRVVQAVKNKVIKEITAFEHGDSKAYFTVLRNRCLFSSNSTHIQSLMQKEKVSSGQISIASFFSDESKEEGDLQEGKSDEALPADFQSLILGDVGVDLSSFPDDSGVDSSNYGSLKRPAAEDVNNVSKKGKRDGLSGLNSANATNLQVINQVPFGSCVSPFLFSTYLDVAKAELNAK